MSSANTLSWMEREPFLRLFNRNGYVLDFNNEKFDIFTQESVGVKIQEKYRLSKGRSLEQFAGEASREDSIKLFTDLLTYYEVYFITKNSELPEYQNYYQQCKKLLSTLHRGPSQHIAGFFNVIIRADESYPIDEARIFESTPSSITAQFKRLDGTPDYDKLRRLPTVMSREFSEDKPAIARIGYLGSNDLTHLELVTASFSTSRISRLLPNLRNVGLRTCWMVAEGDPYRMLGDLRSNIDPVESSAVMKFPKVPVNNKQIAVMMPFNSHYPSPNYDPVYKAIKKAAESFGLSCVRADEQHTPVDINDSILKLIEGSRIIIADLSDSNRNVYYEMGLAHARGRIVIPIAVEGTDLPFDIAHIHTTFFNKNDEYGLQGLTEKLKKVLQSVR